jgi:glycerol-3-phosphate acyltransferase PlsY
MLILPTIGVIFLSYLIGAIPFGLLVVKIINGQDIRTIASGRTGGTNAMRAAGVGAGIATAILDGLKGAVVVWLARWLMPGVYWLHVAAPLMAIMGHNYSIYLLERGKDDRRIRLGGGAGGAPCVGGAFGLWPPSLLIILPLAAGIWYGIGYASVTTMSIALIALVIFTVRAALGLSPWIYVAYGAIAELVVLWALRPNIKRLIDGTERLHGWRARKKADSIRINKKNMGVQ